MHTHPLYGLAMPEHGWVPSPSYVLRRHRVLAHLTGLAPGRAVEVGCGAGALLHDLAARGWTCDGVETSARARELCGHAFAGREDVRAHDAPEAGWTSAFDLLMAFEVLEHIDDDLGALRGWVEWLRPGGLVLISVPAHARRWSASDEWGGHLRRYEREDLEGLLREAGLEVRTIECYGFPLANALFAIRARTWQRGDRRGRAKATAASGVERTVETKLWPLQTSAPGRLAMRMFCRAQDVFLDRELGNGFFAVAQKE